MAPPFARRETMGVGVAVTVMTAASGVRDDENQPDRREQEEDLVESPFERLQTDRGPFPPAVTRVFILARWGRARPDERGRQVHRAASPSHIANAFTLRSSGTEPGAPAAIRRRP
jgi:hypothetical protein